MASKDKEVLIDAVEQAYNNYPEEILERFHALQFSVYRSVMDSLGGNQHYTPHTKVRNRQNNGQEICDLVVPNDLFVKASNIVIGV
jgi:hypothetical protein